MCVCVCVCACVCVSAYVDACIINVDLKKKSIYLFIFSYVVSSLLGAGFL